MLVNYKVDIALSANISLAGLMLEYEIGLSKNHENQAFKVKVIDNGKVHANRSSKGATLGQITINLWVVMERYAEQEIYLFYGIEY